VKQHTKHVCISVVFVAYWECTGSSVLKIRNISTSNISTNKHSLINNDYKFQYRIISIIVHTRV